jgi:hypothetical protein
MVFTKINNCVYNETCSLFKLLLLNIQQFMDFGYQSGYLLGLSGRPDTGEKTS